MNGRTEPTSIDFRLGSEQLGLDVSVRLRRLDGRWLAVAEIDGEPEVGIGGSARVALTAALESLGKRAATALLADPQLFGVSTTVRRIASA